MRAHEFINESRSLPVISFEKLFHVGTMNPSNKRYNSLEGAGLSVSTHPDEWRRIAKGHVFGDTYQLTKDKNVFLNAHKLKKKDKIDISDWSIKEGLLEKKSTVIVSWYDDEMDSEMYVEFTNMKDAEDEMGDLSEYEVKRKTNGYTPTEKLKILTRNPNMGIAGVLDYILPLYAESHNMDGVWWQDTVDVSRYSSPRGVIVSSKVSSWNINKIG